MKDQLHDLVKKKPFYCSLLFDGSTDKTTTEKEVISIKVIENVTPRIRLLGIVEPDTCDAQGILKAVAQKCEENQLCLTATAADGASVHFGKTTGVLTRLQQQSAPWMIEVHCIAHRLELCLKDAFKETYFTQPKKWRQLKDLGEALEEHVLKPTRAQGTRDVIPWNTKVRMQWPGGGELASQAGDQTFSRVGQD
ncbi:hypothetical protein KUCAC02_002144 [Chaenocephalus aceratus]|uniref:Uncharacterized protein n=1 Tax=Chaenocephalus aceratus TaxID=36190 RepID=A0ACB9XSP8_CHAAC|nr:hypothetical protein KUCAC02_002144 [Chaenocephalus aceratus]